MSISLVNDSGKSGDKITNDSRINMGIDTTAGKITYTLKSVIKGKEGKVLGKADTIAVLDPDGHLLLPAASKAGQYVLEIKQNGAIVDTKFSFTIDNVLPSALKVELFNDTGKKSDKITNDATLKLTGLETGATVEWLDSSTGKWEAVATELLSASGKFTLLNANDLLGDDFKGTLAFRQVDVAGNAQKTLSNVALTYDTTAPEVLEVVEPTVDSIANGKSTVVRILSNEKLVGLDKSDFVVSNALASVGTIKEITQADGMIAYDVTLTASKTSGGDVSLSFAKNATVTDVAGNAAMLSEEALAGFWIGNDNLQVSLVEDSGKVGDNITNNGDIKLAAIRADSSIEFRIKENSASMSEGTDWLLIDDLVIDGASETVNVETLYELAGLSLDEMPFDGWKDTIEFHQINNLTNKASAATALTFTYDNYADMFWGEPPESDEVAVGKSVVLQLTSNEKLIGLDKNDFIVTDALASITTIKEQMVKEDDWVYWNYNVTVKAGNKASEDVAVQFAESASITDVAGNEIDLATMDPYLLFIV